MQNRKKELSRIFDNEKIPKEFACSGGHFKEYEDIGYRSRMFEGKTLVVVRSAGGNAGNVTYRKFDPREMIVSTEDLAPEKILEIYYYIEKLQNYYFNIFLPVDLDFLYQKMSSRRILYATLNLFFIKMLFLDYIEKKIAPLNVSVEDAIRECDGILTAQIFDGTTTRRFHSKLTEAQREIFECIGMRKHPSVSFKAVPTGVEKKN